MKGKDLLFLAGGAYLVYMLIPKKATEAAPGVSIIPMPTPGEAPLDIGGLFSGIASIFGAMPTQIIPEINIPEYTMPDWSKYIPEIPDWGQYVPDWGEFAPPDWSQYVPDWGELMPDWDKLLPSIIDDRTYTPPKNGDGVWQYIKPSFPDIIGGMLGARWEGVQSELIDMFAFFTGSPRPYEKWLEIGAETEAIFEVAGISEVTPETLPIFKEAREIITGERAERLPTIGTPEYNLYMGLAPRPAPLKKIPTITSLLSGIGII